MPEENFYEFLRRMVGGGAHNKQVEQEKNPEKFPRSVEITDEQVLMLLADRSVKTDALVERFDEAKLLAMQVEVLRQQVFLRLRKLHPEIAPGTAEDSVPIGFRFFNGKWYYVSWDE